MSSHSFFSAPLVVPESFKSGRVSRVLHAPNIIKMKGFLSLIKAAGQTLWEHTGWDSTRKYLFSVVFVSVVASKILNIYTHSYYLTPNRFLIWGSTFFLQDVIFLLVARAFAWSFQRWSLSIMGGVAILFLGLYVSLLAAATISFYAVMGRDFHWGPAIGFFGDMVDAKALVLGIFGAIFFEIVILVGSYFATPHVYEVTGGSPRFGLYPYRPCCVASSGRKSNNLSQIQKSTSRLLSMTKRMIRVTMSSDYPWSRPGFAKTPAATLLCPG